MTIDIQAYRSAVGRFALIVPGLLFKKMMKMTSGSRDATPAGKVYGGSDIALFAACVGMAAVLLYNVPFCLHMVFCQNIHTAKRSIYDTFTIDNVDNMMCDAQGKNFRLSPHVAPFITPTMLQSKDHYTAHPPPNLRFLLLLCGDIESNPGPSIEETVQRLESKVDSQGERVEEKLNTLIALMNTFQLQYSELNKQLQKLEENISTNIENIQSRLVHLEGSVSSLEHMVSLGDGRVSSVEESQELTTSRLRKLEAELERQERYSRRSNVVLYGMKEERVETYDSCMRIVIGILQRHFPHKTWKEEDIERTHRLGPKSPTDDRPRPMIIRFQRWSDAMSIMRDRDGKNRMSAADRVRVGADLTRQQRDTIREFKAQGKHAYYANGKLIVQDFQSHPAEFRSHPHDFRSYSLESRSYAQESRPHPQESRSYPQESQSYPQESRPHPQESRPHPQESRPHPQGSGSHVRGSRPHPQQPCDRPSDPVPTDDDQAPRTVDTPGRTYAQAATATPRSEPGDPAGVSAERDQRDQTGDADSVGCLTDADEPGEQGVVPAVVASQSSQALQVDSELSPSSETSPRLRGMGRGARTPECASREKGRGGVGGGSGGRGSRGTVGVSQSQPTRRRDSNCSPVMTRNRLQSSASSTQQGTMYQHLSKITGTTDRVPSSAKKNTEKNQPK